MNDVDALAKKMGINLSEKRAKHKATQKGEGESIKMRAIELAHARMKAK